MSANIESVLSETRVFPPSPAFVKQANISGMDAYRKLCAEAEKDFEGFWARLAREHVLWHKPFTKILDESKAPFFRWFDDGELNASYNCLDRHLKTQPDKTAIIFEADDGKVTRITYKELYHEVCRMANGLKALGIKKGDRVLDLHADVDRGGGRDAGLRAHRRHALGGVRRLLRQEPAGAHHRRRRGRGHHRRRAVPRRQGDSRSSRSWTRRSPWAAARRCATSSSTSARGSAGADDGAARHVVARRASRARPDTCEPTWVNAEHPLFILYTSGSTGKPKGVQHSTGGYLLWAILTMKWVFDHKPTRRLLVHGRRGLGHRTHLRLLRSARRAARTEVMFEGVPTYPDAGRFWKMIQDHKVTVFYTAPTAIRSLIKAGGDLPKKYDLSSLRILGTVGEPINPEAWMWYHETVGGEPLPDRRHLVADRDRRPHDHAAARRDADQARLLHAAAARHHRRHRRRDRPFGGQGQGRHPGHQAPLAVDDPHHLGRSGALQEELLPGGFQGQVLPRRRRREHRRGRLLSASWAASTTC